jgi:hypothetical protein
VSSKQVPAGAPASCPDDNGFELSDGCVTEKKMWLIERKNPRWQGLAVDWYPAERKVPRLRMISQNREIMLRSG